MECMPSLEQNLVNQGKRQGFPFPIRINGGTRGGLSFAQRIVSGVCSLFMYKERTNSDRKKISVYRDFLSGFGILAF